MAKHNTCPKHHEIDVYNHCKFDCIYCIAKAACNKNVVKSAGLDEILETIYALEELHPFYLSPWTDCYPEEEVSKKYTCTILQELAKRNLSFFVITKSPLVLRDVEYFIERENAFIAISLNTLDDSIARTFEPKAPSVSERKDLIKKLSSIPYLKTVVKIDPILPGITDQTRLDNLSEWLIKLKPSAITAETLRLSKDMAVRLQSSVDKKMYRTLMSYYSDLNDTPQHPFLEYRIKLFMSLKEKFSAKGIRIAFCKATLPLCITPFDCRGGYL